MAIPLILFGGWKPLQRRYPDIPLEVERTFSGSSMYFGHSLFGFYRQCVDVSVSAQGLRLSIGGVSSRFFLPAMVIDWCDIQQCTRTRMGFVGEALKFRLRGWPSPIYVGRFLWKYGDVCENLIGRWRSAQDEPRNP
jgi:hypothetical protein